MASMNNSNIILDGLRLMLIGMSTVFVFLSVLVFLIILMRKWLSNEIELNDKSLEAENFQTDNNIIAAISSAVHTFRKNNLNK